MHWWVYDSLSPVLCGYQIKIIFLIYSNILCCIVTGLFKLLVLVVCVPYTRHAIHWEDGLFFCFLSCLVFLLCNDSQVLLYTSSLSNVICFNINMNHSVYSIEAFDIPKTISFTGYWMGRVKSWLWFWVSCVPAFLFITSHTWQ